MKKLTQFEKDCIRLSILYALNGDSSVPSVHAKHIAKYVLNTIKFFREKS